jgi:hypothetical protein
MNTRRFIAVTVAACLCTLPSFAAGQPSPLPAVRAITQGPKLHWFGYYDKLQFDPTGRYVLGMEVDFEHRGPRADDVIRVGMVDLDDNDKWIELGTSSAWGWQQGCMLQWRPGSANEILYNDRQGDHYVCRILDVFTGERRTIDHPIYAVSPDGRFAVSPDFRRIQDMRPGYGYAGLPDPCRDELAPADSGIWRVDLETGEAKLIISLADVVKIPYEQDPADCLAGKHWFNHLLFNTDGTRFEFLHRWRSPGDPANSGFRTRMFTAAPDGSDIRCIDPYGKTSHFIWRDPGHILAWAWHPSHGDAFYLYEDGAGKVEVVGKGVMTQNGHCTYLPGNEWILNDTYPQGAGREQNVYLYNVASDKQIPLGGFHLPREYSGEWRCDTHPRFSPDGTKVCIDSPHGGNGRQMYLINIGRIVGDAGLLDHGQGEMAGAIEADSVILQSRLTKGRKLIDGDLPGREGVARFQIATNADFADAMTTTTATTIAIRPAINCPPATSVSGCSGSNCPSSIRPIPRPSPTARTASAGTRRSGCSKAATTAAPTKHPTGRTRPSGARRRSGGSRRRCWQATRRSRF